MTDPDARLHVRTIGSLSEVSAEAWDACAGQSNPFVKHGFLSALEDSGSATAASGWAAQHVVLEDSETGAILGAVPLYVKSHSYGEYVFDWGWADAYERAGGRYYPKAQVCVPFTPSNGPAPAARRGLRQRDAQDFGRCHRLRRQAAAAFQPARHVSQQIRIRCPGRVGPF